MKKISKILLIVLFSVFLVGCGSTGISQEEYNKVVAERDEYKEKYEEIFTEELTDEESEESQKEVGSSNQEDVSNQAEVTGEYHYVDSLGSVHYFLIVKNNSKETLKISVNATAKDSSGNVIGAADASEEAIPAGWETCLSCYFDELEDAAEFEYSLSFKEDEHYKPAVQDLEYEESRTDKKVILTCTNNGEEAAEFVEATALFFSGGEVIRYDTTYITDDDSELKPGATISSELNCYEKYDDVKIYLTGRR